MPDEFPSDPEKNFEFWTDSAREQVEEGEQMLRLMGLDDHTIQAMRKAMEQLYDPATGTLNLDDTILSSPAVGGGAIYLRSNTKIYKLSE